MYERELISENRARLIVVLLVLLATLWGCRDVFGEENVSLRVNRAVCLSPCSAVAMASVPRHKDNRIVALSWYNQEGTFSSSDQRQVDGADAPITWRFNLLDLPDGNYWVIAVIVRVTDGKVEEFSATVPLQVGMDNPYGF